MFRKSGNHTLISFKDALTEVVKKEFIGLREFIQPDNQIFVLPAAGLNDVAASITNGTG